MKRYYVTISAWLFFLSPCLADTFTHRQTGEVFYGYATQEARGDNRILVRPAGRAQPVYLNPADYDIQWDYQGRRNEVYVLAVKDEIELQCETQAFEKAIRIASNRGPLIILVEIDTPGGRIELMERICNAISATTNCRTAAFICGGKHRGAFSAGAAIALSCDSIYMTNGTAIGAATPVVVTDSAVTDVESAFGGAVGEKMLSVSRAYFAAIAEAKGRSGLLAKAMVDKDIGVCEVIEDGNSVFVSPENVKPGQTVVRPWSTRGSLLTLTAAEAVKCGMADKLVGSRKELFSELKIASARLIHDRDIVKAKREFTAVNRRFERIRRNLDYYQKEVEFITGQVESAAEEYNREFGNYKDMLDKSYGARALATQRQLLISLSLRRRDLVSELLPALDGLLLNCNAALVLKRKHPDLPVGLAALEEQINSARMLYERIESTP